MDVREVEAEGRTALFFSLKVAQTPPPPTGAGKSSGPSQQTAPHALGGWRGVSVGAHVPARCLDDTTSHPYISLCRVARTERPRQSGNDTSIIFLLFQLPSLFLSIPLYPARPLGTRVLWESIQFAPSALLPSLPAEPRLWCSPPRPITSTLSGPQGVATRTSILRHCLWASRCACLPCFLSERT